MRDKFILILLLTSVFMICATVCITEYWDHKEDMKRIDNQALQEIVLDDLQRRVNKL